MTVDQRSSVRRGDKVADLLRELDPPTLRGFERTVGDEVQAVLEDAAVVVDVALDLVRRREWSIGIGVGEVHEPLPASTREASGPAFVAARAAVERAKLRSAPVPLAVEGEHGTAADAEAVLRLLASVVRRRSEQGWQAVDLVGELPTQKAVAGRLGISEQAVSTRLRAAQWAEEVAARPVAARLLREAM